MKDKLLKIGDKVSNFLAKIFILGLTAYLTKELKAKAEELLKDF